VFVEILRYTIFFLVCYYYCEKAKRLLTYREECISIIKIVYLSTLVITVILGVVIDIKINNPEDEDYTGKNLCDRLEFQMFRWMPLVMCAVF
jgi:hypothetical protein